MPSSNPRKPAPAKAGLADLKRLRAAPSPEPVARTPAAAGKGGERAGAPAKPAGRQPAAAREDMAAALTAEDRGLFRRSAGAVQRVDTRNRRIPEASPEALARLDQLRRAPQGRPDEPDDAPAMVRHAAAPLAADHGLSDADVSHLLREDGTAFLRAGVGPDVLTRIAQRYWRLDADLDLHGLSVDQARPRLANFITQCVAYEARCVRVVTGKGYGSPLAQPVLRDRVRAWLVGLPDVRAFAQAPERDGGAGAIVVLLQVDARRARDRRIDPR